jgi:ATP-dependent RNA helicase RhlE
MSFQSFGLPETIMQGVYASGYATPTEIQQKAIPKALEGRDIIGCAPTGTGKTAAFVLPILSYLTTNSHDYIRANSPRVLILTPTRELAQQIEDCTRQYASYTDLRASSIYGGVSINNQIRDLQNGLDIVIATPGRIIDHLERRTINLSKVEVFVLDEADRMYDMGFIRDVRKITSRLPAKRQTLLFSATMSKEIRSLISELQQSPVYVEVGAPSTPTELVEQFFYEVPQVKKSDLLVHILKKQEIETMLVFSRTKHGADRIARKLQQHGISSSSLHADRTQGQRLKALEGFKARKFKVLVATDLAARGIDIEKIACVVNFDTPAFAEDYVHRIGRTGRAECKGMSYTFVSEDEKVNLKRIEGLTGKKFELKEFEGFAVPKRVEPDVNTKPDDALNAQRKRKYYRTPKFAFR